MENQCDYCFTVFKTKYILKKHIEKGKKCLKLRENGSKCTSCSHLFSYKAFYKRSKIPFINYSYSTFQNLIHLI